MVTGKHQAQNKSLLINQLGLVQATNIMSRIITGLESNSIMAHPDSSDRNRLPLMCTFGATGPNESPRAQPQRSFWPEIMWDFPYVASGNRSLCYITRRRFPLQMVSFYYKIPCKSIQAIKDFHLLSHCNHRYATRISCDRPRQIGSWQVEGKGSKV